MENINDRKTGKEGILSPGRIVVMGGSFNPPTIAHLKLMLAAIDAVDADYGVFVPSNYKYVKRKMAKLQQANEVFSERLRLEMLQAMAKEDSRLGVDDLEYHRKEKGYTYETMEAVQLKYPDARVYFLAGEDKVKIIPRWHRIQEFLDKFSIIIVRRDGAHPEMDIQEHLFLKDYQERFFIIDAPEGTEGISSSALRNQLWKKDENAKSLCHPDVWALLQKNYLQEKVLVFRDEYRFLSNFWDAPVTYDGLTYMNNEAAFQAQKCLQPEEKEAFTELPPSKAKNLGRRVELRPDWEEVKVGIMEEIVRAKFTQNDELKQKLLATKDMVLEEGNTWNDTFWGVSRRTGEGENHLGKILMKIRDEIARVCNQEE